MKFPISCQRAGTLLLSVLNEELIIEADPTATQPFNYGDENRGSEAFNK